LASIRGAAFQMRKKRSITLCEEKKKERYIEKNRKRRTRRERLNRQGDFIETKKGPNREKVTIAKLRKLERKDASRGGGARSNACKKPAFVSKFPRRSISQGELRLKKRHEQMLNFGEREDRCSLQC